MKVVVTEAASEDLLQIGRTIAAGNPGRAASFVDELYHCCEGLGAFPRAYPLVPNWDEQGVRRRPHRNYLVFYRVKKETVEVLHVLHGARDYVKVLFPEE